MWTHTHNGLLEPILQNHEGFTTWANVTNPPVILGGQWTVTNALSGNAKFFRLRKP